MRCKGTECRSNSLFRIRAFLVILQHEAALPHRHSGFCEDSAGGLFVYRQDPTYLRTGAKWQLFFPFPSPTLWQISNAPLTHRTCPGSWSGSTRCLPAFRTSYLIRNARAFSCSAAPHFSGPGPAHPVGGEHLQRPGRYGRAEQVGHLCHGIQTRCPGQMMN